MKKLLLLAGVCLAVSLPAWGQAEFREVSGKVEIQVAGGAWTPAAVGMEIENSTLVSTGFGARAVIAIGASTVNVEQLTRMELEAIIERDDTVETRLNLPVGRVSAQVRSSGGRSQDFQVRSPISTAAVRGTDFSFDGEELSVSEGLVSFVSSSGVERPVAAGEKSRISEGGKPASSPVEEAEAEVSTLTGPIGAGGTVEAEPTVTQGGSSPISGSIVIVIE